MYGRMMRPYPLICAPVNEMGVVFLFGAVAERLGFWVLRIQTEYPDCETLRMIDEDRCQLVKIEFEHESRNFLKHMHLASECDLLVCWKHNWPECPLEVVELREQLAISCQQGNICRRFTQMSADEEIARSAGIPKIAEIEKQNL